EDSTAFPQFGGREAIEPAQELRRGPDFRFDRRERVSKPTQIGLEGGLRQVEWWDQTAPRVRHALVVDARKRGEIGHCVDGLSELGACDQQSIWPRKRTAYVRRRSQTLEASERLMQSESKRLSALVYFVYIRVELIAQPNELLESLVQERAVTVVW